jgi:predicted transcriptional regulator
MSTIDFPFHAIRELTFRPKSKPLPADLRPLYKITFILMVLKINSRDKTASLIKLQFFNWILKKNSMEWLDNEKIVKDCDFSLDKVHLDPTINQALNYATAEELVTITRSSRYQLTDKGNEFLEKVLRDEPRILLKEREFLMQIGKMVPEAKLRR